MVEPLSRAQNRILRWQWQGGLDRSPPSDAGSWKEGLAKPEFYPVIICSEIYEQTREGETLNHEC